MRLTNHGTERMDERVGLSPDAAERLAARALVDGIRHGELKGRAGRYLDGLFFSHRNANNMRVYGEHVYLFRDETLVTVLHLPHQFKAAVAKARRRG